MRALILVDIQNDFVPGGALAVTEGDGVVPVANSLMDYADLIVATQDWHPPDHASFASQHYGHSPGDEIELRGLPQILWPDHCVQNTPGADFVDSLHVDRIDRVVKKGTDRNIDSYSGFFDNNHEKDTGLKEYLESRGVNELLLVGLATDYCVKFTALDAVQLGFTVTLVTDGVRGVDLQPGDCEKAIGEMKAAGAVSASSDELIKGAS